MLPLLGERRGIENQHAVRFSQFPTYLARQLVQQSEEAQLVVVGNRGRGGFAGMLVGSVGETVAQMARVPVIVARESLD